LEVWFILNMNLESNLDDSLARLKVPIIVGIVGFVLLIGGIISSGIIPKTFIKSSKQLPPLVSASEVSGVKKVQEVKVDVSGAVKTPGVYSLPFDARVEDALKIAGGVTESVDPTYLSKTINLAQKVVDGMKIYVPSTGETSQVSSVLVSNDTISNQQVLININTATPADLDKLSGVGPVTAQKIIDNRPYSGIEDLLTKKVVSRSVYEKIKGLVNVW